ncbi:hypothetical protein C8R46DRAFT_1356091 [Mycena filopes]|nr:hypothetical protein C8R46DRAFT_1356091 [Mycena filopes]
MQSPSTESSELEPSEPFPSPSPPPSTGLFDHLCIEVLQEIGSLLSNGDQMNLRAVCRELGLAIDPLFYTYFVLRGDRLCEESGLHILEKLVAGQLGWCRHAKTIHITPVQKIDREAAKQGPKWYPSEPSLPNLLVSALAAMHNIQTVIWDATSKDPHWVKAAIRDALPTLPHLSSLRLKAEGALTLGLTPIPTLTSLRVSNDDYRPLQTVVDDVCDLIAQSPKLTSLHFSALGTDLSRVWTLLRATQLRTPPRTPVHLAHLTASTLTPDLLAYLSSYSTPNTLRTLTLGRATHGPPAKPDPLAAGFFETVLPAHAGTLVALRVPACHEGRWSFGLHCADAVLMLRRLERLEMSVNPGEVLGVEGGRDAVTLLLTTAAHLPALQLLKITSADPHRRGMDDAIRAAVERYTTLALSSLVVCVANSYSYPRHYHNGGAEQDSDFWYALAPVLSDEELEGGGSTVFAYAGVEAGAEVVGRVRGWD